MRWLLALMVVLLPGAALAGPADAILAQAAADCAAFEDGSFTAGPDAVQEIDLTGDGLPEVVVDAGRFQCSSAASLYGGSGGTGLTVIVGDTAVAFLAEAWTVTGFAGRKVLLVWHNGVDCGGIGVDPCVEALIWNGERFMTVRPGG